MIGRSSFLCCPLFKFCAGAEIRRGGWRREPALPVAERNLRPSLGSACREPGAVYGPRVMVTKLLHTRMRVNDLERTVKFYEEALGLKVARRTTSPRGAKLAFIQPPGGEEEIELCELPDSPDVQVQPDLVHLAFAVDDLEKFATDLKRRGYALSDGPTKTSSGSVIAFIDAPEGYEIELIQRAK